MIGCAFDLHQIPTDLDDCFSRWLNTFLKHDKKLVLVGTATLLSAIWKCCNDIIFDRKWLNDPFGLIKMMCNWILDWAVLQIKDPVGNC